MLASHRNAQWLLGATFVIATLNVLSSAAGFAALTEALPRELRSGVLSTVYAVSIAVFGGTTQLAETWLIHASGSVLAPAWYLIGATVIGIVAMALMPETAPVRVRK
jgi:hypothetical protein